MACSCPCDVPAQQQFPTCELSFATSGAAVRTGRWRPWSQIVETALARLRKCSKTVGHITMVQSWTLCFWGVQGLAKMTQLWWFSHIEAIILPFIQAYTNGLTCYDGFTPCPPHYNVCPRSHGITEVRCSGYTSVQTQTLSFTRGSLVGSTSSQDYICDLQ